MYGSNNGACTTIDASSRRPSAREMRRIGGGRARWTGRSSTICWAGFFLGPLATPCLPRGHQSVATTPPSLARNRHETHGVLSSD